MSSVRIASIRRRIEKLEQAIREEEQKTPLPSLMFPLEVSKETTAFIRNIRTKQENDEQEGLTTPRCEVYVHWDRWESIRIFVSGHEFERGSKRVRATVRLELLPEEVAPQ